MMRTKHDYEDKAMASAPPTGVPRPERPGVGAPTPGTPPATPPPTPPEPVEPPDAEYQAPEEESEEDAEEEDPEAGKQPPLSDTGARPAP